jgi:GDP-4-dehydro-6-deoxy-D-mannose reductase
MRILVTGAEGTSARLLIDSMLKQPGVELHLTDIAVQNGTMFRTADLTRPASAYELIRETAPEQIYNLAGTFSNDYKIDYRANVLITKNILDGILRAGIKCRVLLIGSAAEYGQVREGDNPIKETQALRPMTIYGLTKTYQTHLMTFYHSVFGMDIVMARPFNLLGEGFSNRLFVGRLFEQIQQYKERKIDKIVLGNLNCRRDYIVIGEAVKQYQIIMKYGASGSVYNVGSGKSIKMRDLLLNILSANELDMSVVEERSTRGNDKFDVEEVYADITSIRSLHREGEI